MDVTLVQLALLAGMAVTVNRHGYAMGLPSGQPVSRAQAELIELGARHHWDEA
jgi:hypothetical protein